MNFHKLLFAAKNVNCDKYKEIILLLKEKKLNVKYNIIVQNNRRYIDLHPRYKILDNFLFNELKKQYSLNVRNYSLRGTYYAIKDSYEKFLSTKYHLKTDIEKFYENVNLDLLYEKIKDFKYLNLLKQFLNFPVKGLPLGVIVSTYLSNIYLNHINIKNCFIYVDDILVFSNEKEELIKIKNDLILFLKNLNLNLNFNKTEIKENIELSYLGYIMRRDILFPRTNIMKNFYNKIEYLNNPIINAYKPYFVFS